VLAKIEDQLEPSTEDDMGSGTMQHKLCRSPFMPPDLSVPYQSTLAEKNDAGESFETIANWIEANL
jgi:hypothetical protein